MAGRTADEVSRTKYSGDEMGMKWGSRRRRSERGGRRHLQSATSVTLDHVNRFELATVFRSGRSTPMKKGLHEGRKDYVQKGLYKERRGYMKEGRTM
jgi:hypothetical protein